MKLITNRKLQDILTYNTDGLMLELSTITNRNLLDSFMKNFDVIGTYQTTDPEEKIQLQIFGKVYIDEFKQRIKASDKAGLLEFGIMLQGAMIADGKRTPIETFLTRNLVRLYSYVIDVMRAKGIPPKELKKGFL